MTKKQMVVKDNNLISATYSLGVAEQRLIFLAIIEAREQNKFINVGKSLRIYAKSYEKQFNVEKHTAYESMKRAVEGLYEAGFAYSKIDDESGELGHYKSRWVDKIGYIDNLGCVELVFASDVVPLITRLEKRYTEYELKQVSSLQSEYAIRLYELIIQWKSVGKTNKILLDDLRMMLGVDTEQYKKMCNFKAKVLDLAVKQINQHTDITVDYEQHKNGRIISGFTFRFKVKKDNKSIATKTEKRDCDTPDMLTALKMTDKQRGTFAAKLSKMVELSNYAKQNEDYNQFAIRIESDLLDENKQRFYLPYLEKLGFKTA